MDPQDFPIRHFSQLAEIAAELKALPAQVLDHGYSYQSFGSWSTVMRYRGILIRVLFDGKEGELRLQRSASVKPPYDWADASWRRAVDSAADIPVRELLDAIRTMGAG